MRANVETPQIAINPDMLRVHNHGTLPDGVKFIEVCCQDSDAYCNLPDCILGVFNENKPVHTYGKTGWNSDRNIAYYKSNAPYALKTGSLR
jgi:hypothetical protein